MGETTRKSHLSPKTSERTLPQGITANIFHVKYKLYNPNELDKMFLQKFAVSKWAKNMKTDLSCSIIEAGEKGEKCQTCKGLTADPKGKRPTSRCKNFAGLKSFLCSLLSKKILCRAFAGGKILFWPSACDSN